MYANNDAFVDSGASRSLEYYELDAYNYTTEDTNEENNAEGSFIVEPTEGMWTEHCALTYSSSPVTFLDYDSNQELLWATYEDGRVSSFNMNFNSTSEEFEQPRRYSSFVSCDESIFQLIPLHSFVLSVAMTSIHMHTIGGIALGKFCTAPSGLNEDGIETCFSFTCAAALHPPGALANAESGEDTHIIVGTSSNFAYVYDINVLDGDPLLVYDVCSPTVCVRANDSHLAVAGMDGKVRILDSRLRNLSVMHTFDAHTGPVRDLCLHPDGSTMFTCGVISRPVNPFDPKSPINVSDIYKRSCCNVNLLIYSNFFLFFVPKCLSSTPLNYPSTFQTRSLRFSISECRGSGAQCRCLRHHRIFYDS